MSAASLTPPAPVRSIALSGPMGVGKSTVARVVAARAGLPCVDVDAAIEARAGVALAELFEQRGEHAFRAMERDEIARALDGAPCVLALGGGAVTDAATRRLLLARSIVVTLEAPVDVLLARLGTAGVASRPLLAGFDAGARLSELIVERRPFYAEAHARIDGNATPEAIAEAVLAVVARNPIAVPLGARSYGVDVRRGALDGLAPTLRTLTRSMRDMLVVSDDATWPCVGAAVERALATKLEPLLIAAGEVHKTIVSVERMWDAALARGLDRRGVMLAVGGGVVGDLTGFAAATLLRGVRVVQVPTTLLAMVDASVGGKTAIDRPQGKNLVGAFHQPSAVVVDVDLLATLPLRDLRSGLAEIVKIGVIGDARLFEALERSAAALAIGDLAAVAAVTRAPIAYKARIVADDELETTGARATLNFGHTVGHALEAFGGFDRWTHGEAVSLGMVAALDVGVAQGTTPRALRDRVEALLSALGLPTRVTADELRAALPYVARDKKRDGERITFILAPALGETRLMALSPDEIAAALAAQA